MFEPKNKRAGVWGWKFVGVYKSAYLIEGKFINNDRNYKSDLLQLRKASWQFMCQLFNLNIYFFH